MSLTDQVPSTITIAVQYPVRAFKFENLNVECVKAYDSNFDTEELYLVQILDAIKDYKHIPGTSPRDAYDRIFKQHVSLLEYAELQKLVRLSKNYPPRARKLLSRMLHENGNIELEEQVLTTICPTTRFNLP